MIDFIKLIKPKLSEEEISTVVWSNDLQTNSKDGVVYYDNQTTKNLAQQQGVFIKVETDNRLNVQCSLHKFYNERQRNDRSNFNLFSMSQAKEAMTDLINEKSLPLDGLRINAYEIGLNLCVSKDCRAYMDKMKSIRGEASNAVLFSNPKYEDERVKTSIFPKKIRKHYKIYDKVFEMRDKKRKEIPDYSILRIETVYTRVDNCLVKDFFCKERMRRLIERFFKDWMSVQFEQDITTPKGTGRARQYLCIDLMDKGRDYVIKEAKDRYKRGSLKEWEYRNIREFVQKEWDVLKEQIQFIQSEEEIEFRDLLRTNYILLRNDEKLR